MSSRKAVAASARGAPDVPWAVTASANPALRGVDVRPGDVDVTTTAGGASVLADAFADRVGNEAPPEPAADVATDREFPPVAGRPVPVGPPSRGLSSRRALGREGRVRAIEARA